jgi:general secretion pathway protein B
MSYILDALKKAEAERHSGAASAGRSHPVFATAGKRSSSGRTPWRWGVGILSALAIGLASFAWFGATRGKAPLVPNDAAPSVTQAATLPPTEEKLPPAAVNAPAIPKEKTVRTTKTPEKKQRQAHDTTPLAPAPVNTGEASIATLRELPEQIQREIPPLAISGYIYSRNKAESTVLINNRLLHEGDEVAPGLTLEKMMPNGMLLNYKGYLYRASY